METIYLVGQISPKYEITYLWRKYVRDYFCGKPHVMVKGNVNLTTYGRPEIEIIDPCSNSFNKKYLEKNSYAVTKENRTFGLDLIVPKDLTAVQRSSIAIVNMNQYDPSKPLIGSFFELSWLYMYPEKAVIAFADDLDDYQCQHPFVQQTVNVWCNNEKEACELVEKYFVSMEGC